MAFEKGNAYSLSNLSFCGISFNVNHYITFTRSFYYKSKDEIYDNIRKLTFAFDYTYANKYYERAIVLLDEDNGIIDVIEIGSPIFHKQNSYYLSFVVDNVYGDMDDWLEDCGIRSISVDTINASIFFDSGVIGRTHNFKCEYKDNIYQNYINGLDETIAPITLQPLIDYTLYKCPITVYCYVNADVGWEDNTPGLDITSLVVNQETKVVDIGNLPIERTTDTTPPGNLESFGIFCDAKNENDTIHFLLGDPTGSSYGRISKIDGEPEVYYDVLYGSNKTIVLSLDNYYFTTDSIFAIKNWLINLITEEETIELPCESIDCILNDNGTISITFNKIFEAIDEENFGIYIPGSIWKGPANRYTSDVNAMHYPIVSLNIAGNIIYNVETGEPLISGTQFDYKSELRLYQVVSQGYYETDKHIQIIADGIDITNDSSKVVIDDGAIIFNSLEFSDILINNILSREYTFNVYNGNILIRSWITEELPYIRFAKKSDNEYRIDVDDEYYDFELVVSELKDVIGLGKNNLSIIDRGYGRYIHMVDYAENYIVNFYIIIGNKPADNTITMNLFRSKAEKNKVDKSLDLTFIISLNGTLRQQCSVMAPIITFEKINNLDIFGFNYIYIPEFKRYYFVADIKMLNDKLVDIYLKVDVLMTYKAKILELKAVIARNEFNYNIKLNDSDRTMEQSSDYSIIDIAVNDYPLANYDENNGYIIQGIRGSW